MSNHRILALARPGVTGTGNISQGVFSTEPFGIPTSSGHTSSGTLLTGGVSGNLKVPGLGSGPQFSKPVDNQSSAVGGAYVGGGVLLRPTP